MIASVSSKDARHATQGAGDLADKTSLSFNLEPCF